MYLVVVYCYGDRIAILHIKGRILILIQLTCNVYIKT